MGESYKDERSDEYKQIIDSEHQDEVEFDDIPEESSSFDPESLSTRVSWKKRLVLSLVVSLMLTTFVGVLLFVAPRRPDVKLVSFEFDEHNPSSPDENGELVSNWIGKVSINSANFYDVHVRSIDVKAYVASNLKIPVGFGRLENIIIKKKSETIIQMPFKVPVYQPSSGKPSLIEECMAHQKASLVITAEIDLNAIHWTGQKIKTSINKVIDCQLPQLYQLLAKYL